MPDILALTKSTEVQEQVKKLRSVLDPSKKSISPTKTIETRNEQIDKIKAYLRQMNESLATQKKTVSSKRPIVAGETLDQFNDSLSPTTTPNVILARDRGSIIDSHLHENSATDKRLLPTTDIENIFADALSVTAEEVQNFKLSQVQPLIAVNVEKFDPVQEKPDIAVEFSEGEYNQFAKMLVENFALLAKQHLPKERIATGEFKNSVTPYPVLGKYTQKVVESKQATQRFVSEVSRPTPSNFHDWFGGPGYNISHQMRDEFSEYLHGKMTKPQAVTKLKKIDDDTTAPSGPFNKNLSHQLQRTRASQERIFNKRSFVELLELLNSVRINGHNNSGHGSGRS